MFLGLALSAGLSVFDFWDLTPREVRLVLKNFEEKQRSHYEDLTWLAWHVAVFERQKTIPPLKQLLSRGKTRVLEGEELERRRQEFKEMSEAWHNRPH